MTSMLSMEIKNDIIRHHKAEPQKHTYIQLAELATLARGSNHQVTYNTAHIQLTQQADCIQRLCFVSFRHCTKPT